MLTFDEWLAGTDVPENYIGVSHMRDAWNAATSEIQAERAAVLEPMTKLVSWYKTNHPTNPWPCFGYPNLDNLWREVDVIVSTTDRLALDRHVEEKVQEAREWCIDMIKLRLDKEYPPVREIIEAIRAVPAVPEADYGYKVLMDASEQVTRVVDQGKPEAVCPRCEGNKMIPMRGMHECPDCTGERADAKGKR